MGGYSESSPLQGWDFRDRPLSPLCCFQPQAERVDATCFMQLQQKANCLQDLLHVCLRVTRVSDLLCAEFSFPAYFVAFSSVD